MNADHQIGELVKTKNTFNMVFVTAAELPATSGLHASQVFEPARHMAKSGHNVTWIAAVPLFSYIKDVFLRTAKLCAVRNSCKAAGINFVYLVTPLAVGSSWAFMVRKPTLRWAAKHALKHLQSARNKPTVLHARSYYGTHLACQIKAQATNEQLWRISFDMRSILPEEFPLTQGWLGKIYFGFAKQWEYELLRESDLSFLPLNYARYRIKFESGCNVTHVPIHGIDREPGWSVNFEKRWVDKYVGYAGSIGAWHDPALLGEMIKCIKHARPKLAMDKHSSIAGLDSRSYSQSDMPAYYDSLLALVIPGRRDFDNYFVSFKMRGNFFSTKAVEALTRGVPLIVSSELTELAEFVQVNDCGAIYDPFSSRIVHPGGDWLEDERVWRRLTENAKRVGESLTRSNVMLTYIAKWNSLFE